MESWIAQRVEQLSRDVVNLASDIGAQSNTLAALEKLYHEYVVEQEVWVRAL